MRERTVSYAVSEEQTRSRRVAEPAHPYRGVFERDRDRIIHSEAFRRLEGKTQVFTPGVNDNFRTRLTHSIEVAQIGRTLARELGLNESLTEAICLGHDIGHAPFGHEGERVLNGLMQEHGGFEHNRQALRIVDEIENPYPDRPGLNLMYETRLGLAKHSSLYDRPGESPFAERHCTLEGQVADTADRIAYNCHDLEDGLRSRILDEDEMKDIAIFEDAAARIGANRISNRFIRRTRIAKSVIEILVTDCIKNSASVLETAGVKSVAEVCGYDDYLIALSCNRAEQLHALELFLLENMYRHPELRKSDGEIHEWLSRLFDVLCREPDRMPYYYQKLIEKNGVERTVCDYISGMTDRYCMEKGKELT